MIGTNTIEMNEATLLAALNFYFETVYKIVPTATAISETSKAGYGRKTFTITIMEKKPDQP
jgi:hypothetical protein